MMLSVLRRILAVVWGVALALFSVLLLGRTHILSQLFGTAHLATAVDVLLVVLAVIYAFALRFVFMRLGSVWPGIAALLPPCLLFAVILFF